MLEKDKKVKINYKKMGLIKKFRIKGFKNKLPIAKLDKISLSFAKRQILDNISFNLNSGEIVGLLGPNGAGKSTIFNILMGLVKPDFGKIIIEGDDATSYPIYLEQRNLNWIRASIWWVFNDLSLLENLKSVGEIIVKDERERISKIHDLISKFALDNVQEVKAKFLSGGQRRKLVICMALLGDPKILL